MRLSMKARLLCACIFIVHNLSAQWIKTYSYDTASYVQAQQLLLDGKNTYVSSMGNKPSIGGLNISKLDSYGNIIWNRQYNILGYSGSMMKTNDGKLLIAGYSNNHPVIIKIDTYGNIIWSKEFKETGAITSLKQASSGDILVQGITDHSGAFLNDHPYFEVLDSTAETIKKSYILGTTGWMDWFFMGEMILTSDGGAILVCSRNFKTFLIKFDSNYNLSWEALIELNGSGFFDASNIAEVSDGYIYAGRETQHLMLGKIDKYGNPVWNKSYLPVSTADKIKLIILNQNLYLAGFTYPNGTMNPVDFLMMQTDMTGDVLICRTSSVGGQFFSTDLKYNGEDWIGMTYLNDSHFQIFSSKEFAGLSCLNDVLITSIQTPAITKKSVSDYMAITDSTKDFVAEMFIATITDTLVCGREPTTVVSTGGEFNVPNIFTPNGDGINDLFYFSSQNVSSLTCDIFNRWGERIYKFSDASNAWDGKGFSEGVYFYTVTGEYFNHSTFKRSGSITLLR